MISLNLQDYKGYYLTVSGITKKNHDVSGTTTELPVTEDFSAPLWTKDPITGRDAYWADQLCNGQSYIAVQDDEYTEQDPIIIVREFNSEGIVADKAVHINDVNPNDADFYEMYAYTTYLQNSGKVPNAHENFMRIVREEAYENNLSTDKIISTIKKNYLDLIKNYMEWQLKEGLFDSYLSVKKMYDYMNHISTD